MKKLGDLLHSFRGFDEETKLDLEHVRKYLTVENYNHVEYMLKFRKAKLDSFRFPVTSAVLEEYYYPKLVCQATDTESTSFVEQTNKTIEEGVLNEQCNRFSKKSAAFLPQFLCPHILGLDTIKEAIILQLCMNERFHILLLGDPGTGKTDLLRSAVDLSVKSSFGLGSGSSKAGLSGTVVGKEIHPGILAQAHGGLCCIDELNLMKAEDRAGLYNAMEKGFVTYDKGASHERFDADIRLLATANPKGDQFRGSDLATIRKQLPFDAALISRFHLVFLLKKPDLKKFRAISQQVLKHKQTAIAKQDVLFMQKYFQKAKETPVSLPSELEGLLLDAVTKFKAKEKKLLVEITPRLTKGLVAMACARARLELRHAVTRQDIQYVLAIVERSFTIE